VEIGVLLARLRPASGPDHEGGEAGPKAGSLFPQMLEIWRFFKVDGFTDSAVSTKGRLKTKGPSSNSWSAGSTGGGLNTCL
jgi:hypothetical protein